jgi:hypothetical protein
MSVDDTPLTCSTEFSNLGSDAYAREFQESDVDGKSSYFLKSSGSGNSKTYSYSTGKSGLVPIYATFLTSSSVSAIISDLKSKKIILSSSDYDKLIQIYQDEAKGNATSQGERAELEGRNSKFLKHLNYEYCFYYRLYTLLLNKFFTILQTSTLPAAQQFTETTINITGITSKDILIQKIQALNAKLTKITQVVNAIAADAQSMWQAKKSLLADSNTSLKTSIDRLNASSQVASINSLETQRKAIEYTREKNTSVNMTLAIYAFLNISALAIILHIATQ